MSFEHILTKDGFELLSCPGCSLVFVGNPPTDEQRARLYSFQAGYHVGLARDAHVLAWHAREATRNLAVLQRHARSGRLLDVGCSTGLFLNAARAADWPGEGLEYSPDSARVAVQTHRLDVKCGELHPDTYALESFDVITLWDVIEHVPDPARTLALLSQVLARGGLLLLKTPNAGGLYPALSRRVAKTLGFWGHAEPPGHLFQFSEATLRRMVCDAGFEVVAVHQQRIPVTYSFGTARQWFRSAKWALFCLFFVPLVVLGPWFGRGDDMVLVARRPG